MIAQRNKIGISYDHAVDVRRRRRPRPRARQRRRRVPDRRRRAGGDAADHRRLPRRSAPRSTAARFWDGAELRRERARSRPASPCSPGSRTSTPLILDLQPAPRLPARRRPDRPRDRLAAHRQSRPGDDLRRPARPGLRLRVHRDRDPARPDRQPVRRRLAGADRLDARRLGPRDREPQQAQHEARRPPRRRRHGRRAGRDPGRRRPSSRRSTSTSSATGWPWFPVVDAGQRFIGLLNRGHRRRRPGDEPDEPDRRRRSSTRADRRIRR